jgi:predicted nucleic acid-binding protein
MSHKGEDRAQPRILLGDTDLFFFFLRGGVFEGQAAIVIAAAEDGRLIIRTSSEVYDDAVSAIRAGGASLELANDFVADMKSIPHTSLPMSAEIAERALQLYRSNGGRRRLSYFDSFHVATAMRYDLPMLTSDRFIIQNAPDLGMVALDLAKWPWSTTRKELQACQSQEQSAVDLLQAH